MVMVPYHIQKSLDRRDSKKSCSMLRALCKCGNFCLCSCKKEKEKGQDQKMQSASTKGEDNDYRTQLTTLFAY